MPTNLRPTTVALMLASTLYERYCGATTNPEPEPATPGSTESIENPVGPNDPVIVTRTKFDPEFEDLIKTLREMDARTGTSDPTVKKRRQKTTKKLKGGAKRKALKSKW